MLVFINKILKHFDLRLIKIDRTEATRVKKEKNKLKNKTLEELELDVAAIKADPKFDRSRTDRSIRRDKIIRRKDEIRLRIKDIVMSLLEKYCYRLTDESEYYLLVEKADVKVQIYFQPLTIITLLKHPKKGETALRRDRLQLEDIEDILRNPRVHLNTNGKYINIKNLKKL